MKLKHKSLSYLPMLIVINWVFCFVFWRNASFYIQHIEFFDYIDTLLVSFSLIHFFFYYEYYGSKSKNCLLCIASIIVLTLVYDWIIDALYYFLYFLILTITAYKSIV